MIIKLLNSYVEISFRNIVQPACSNGTLLRRWGQNDFSSEIFNLRNREEFVVPKFVVVVVEVVPKPMNRSGS